MNRVSIGVFLLILEILGKCAASDIFDEAENLRNVLSGGNLEELRELDETGDLLAPWLVDVWLRDEAAREFIGEGAISLRSIVAQASVSTFVSRVSDGTFDIYYATPDPDGKFAMDSDRLYRTLLVCRLKSRGGNWYFDSSFCFLETEGPFDKE